MKAYHYRIAYCALTDFDSFYTTNDISYNVIKFIYCKSSHGSGVQLSVNLFQDTAN